jgi:hypothetical protein
VVRAESQSISRRTGSIATITFVVWALWTVVLSTPTLLSWFDSRQAIVCGDFVKVFSRGQGTGSEPFYLFDDDRLAVVDREGFYPFQITSALNGISRPNTLRIIDRASGDTLSERTTTIDGIWSNVGRVIALSEQILVWTYIERRDLESGNPVRSYRRFLTDGNTETEVGGNAAFEPRALDTRHQWLASLEERQRVMGGQPKEYDLPPQTVRIESLAGIEPITVATFPARRVLRMFFDDDALLVLRWENEQTPPSSNYRYRIFLDRHDLPGYTTTWTTELTPRPTLRGYGPDGPKYVVAQAQPNGKFAISYLDHADGLFIRDVQVDTTNGEVLASSTKAFVSRWKSANQNRAGELVWRTHVMGECVYEASKEGE